jgi:type IV secretory pathway TrbD component
MNPIHKLLGSISFLFFVLCEVLTMKKESVCEKKFKKGHDLGMRIAKGFNTLLTIIIFVFIAWFAGLVLYYIARVLLWLGGLW